jgi:flagellar hook assembly protein FlgD
VTTQPGLGDLSTGTALLNRAVPNPFSGSTAFSYRVADGGSKVDVGVYNVAGRLVKTLASGSQDAGVFTVTWDGTDAAGVRMAPGVYFLRSRVGNESNVSRVIYIAR